MANAPECCHWELATILASDSDSQQDARKLSWNTFFFIFIYLFYIILFHFTSVWLDNLEPDLQKGWALTADREIKTAGGWAGAMLNYLIKSLESDEFQSWNPKWVNSFTVASAGLLQSISSLCASACRRGTAAHFTIAKMKRKWTYCLLNTCVLLRWALWIELVRTLIILDSGLFWIAGNKQLWAVHGTKG